MDLIEIRLTVSELFENVYSSFPKELYELIKNKTYIAGGCFKSLVLNEKVNDWDFWFRDKESCDKFVQLIGDVKKTESTILTNHDRLYLNRVLIKTDNVYTLKLPNHVIQFITTEVGEPEVVINKFDFRHAQCYYDPKSSRLHVPTGFIIGKQLIYNKEAASPLSSLKRIVKFVKQGWDIGDDQVEMIAKAISGVEWSNPEVVKKQRRGLYYAPRAALNEPEPATYGERTRAARRYLGTTTVANTVQIDEPNMTEVFNNLHVFGDETIQVEAVATANTQPIQLNIIDEII